jgi:hypothetical protein
VLTRHNIQPNTPANNNAEEEETPSNQKKRIFTTSGNSGKGDSAPKNEPTTFEEKMTQRRLEKNGSEMNSRQNIYKTN